MSDSISTSSGLSSSRRRQRRGLEQGAAAQEPALLRAAWGLLVKPHVVGLLLSAAGGLLIIAPWLKAPKRLGASWWTNGFEDANIVMFVAVLLALGAPLLIGLWWQRRAQIKELVPIAQADLLMSEPHPETPKASIGALPLLGAALMIVGALMGVGTWFMLWRDVLPTQAAISVGQPTEFVRAEVAGEPLRLMLPRRVTISNVRMAAPQSVEMTFSLPKQNDAPTQTLGPRESIDVAGKRFTFIGLINDPQNLRVILGGSGEQSIEATGRVGQKVKVSLDGPEFEVKQILRNYLGAMGPAVQLSSESTGTFWLFERQVNPKLGPAFDHGLKLVRLETLPAAVFNVSPELPFWPLITSVILFVLGAGGLFGAPQLSPVGRRGLRAFSLQEAGRWAESLQDEREADDELAAGEEE